MRITHTPEHLDERIRSRAYQLYLSRGCAHGADIEDWLRAEREVIDRMIVETVEAGIVVPKLAA